MCPGDGNLRKQLPLLSLFLFEDQREEVVIVKTSLEEEPHKTEIQTSE